VAVFVVVATVFAVGVLVGGAAGAVLLGLLAVGAALLLAASWAQLRPPERALRVFVLLTLIAIAISVAR
jgi:hypothetical protein